MLIKCPKNVATHAAATGSFQRGIAELKDRVWPRSKQNTILHFSGVWKRQIVHWLLISKYASTYHPFGAKKQLWIFWSLLVSWDFFRFSIKLLLGSNFHLTTRYHPFRAKKQLTFEHQFTLPCGKTARIFKEELHFQDYYISSRHQKTSWINRRQVHYRFHQFQTTILLASAFMMST